VNELDLLKLVASRLNDAEIGYMISGSVALTFYGKPRIDFIIRKNQEYRILEFNNRKKMKLEDQEVWVVSLEDLIISKLYWAKDSFSEMQIKDIVSLIDLDFDMEYVEEWCTRLGLDLILRRVLDERHQ
jgi:hypothetical protein